jgi:hypothetical protein
MSLGGGGSTPGGPSGGLFIPPGQAQAAAAEAPIVQSFSDQSNAALGALGGISPAQTAYPGVLGAYQSTLNNPFAGDAITGATGAENYFLNQISPTLSAYAGTLGGVGNNLVGTIAPDIGNQLIQQISGQGPYGAAAGVGAQQSGLFNSGYGADALQLGSQLGFGGSPLIPQGNAAGQSLLSQVPSALSLLTNPQISGGASQLMSQIPQALSYIGNPTAQAGADYGVRSAGQLENAANSILNLGLDPQQALYSRTAQQVTDAQQAANAAAGIGSSPYGAGVAGQTAANFNIDWQNNLLGRQATAGQTAAGELGQGQSNIQGGLGGLLSSLTSGTGAGSNLLTGAVSPLVSAITGGTGAASQLTSSGLGALTNPTLAALSALGSGATTAQGLGQSAIESLLTPANAQSAAQLQGANALGSVFNTGTGGISGAGSLLGSVGQGLSQYLGLPYTAENAITGNQFTAAQNLTNLGNANYLLPQQTIGDINSYLNLGQSASTIANQIGATNFAQGQATGQGIGQLLGGANTLFGGGGGAGASGGLLGNLFGPSQATIDAAGGFGAFGGGSDLAATAAAGSADAGASLAPLAFLGS